MKRSQPSISFKDERGVIKDLVCKTNIDTVTLIESHAGAIRGNHFHRDTEQYIYLLSGKIRYLTRDPLTALVQEDILQAGDLLYTAPLEAHAMEILEASTFLVLTRGPRSGEDFESDTFRLEDPLIRPR